MPIIRSEASPEDLLDAVAQFPTEELARFAERVATARAEGVAPHVSHDEGVLLRRIANGLECARERCEYCRSHARFATQAFSVEHVTPRSLGGTTTFDNLALACQGCNNHKYIKE